MRTIEQTAALREELASLRARGEIGFVPTMGNLHQGHLQLVREAKRRARHVVASIFVNPLQFGPEEDLDKYPRTLAADQEALTAEGVSLLFTPSVETLYPVPLEQQTRVSVPGISSLYCGASRPGHFDGVATVVCKLFNIVQPDIAVFGRKDYQQLAVIRRMVGDLAMPVEILGVDTVREQDGLAMSSRNQYLRPEERALAPGLYTTLRGGAERIRAGERDYRQLAADLRTQLDSMGFRSDYIEVVDADTLLSPGPEARCLAILAAAWLGAARLIDNVEIPLAAAGGSSQEESSR